MFFNEHDWVFFKEKVYLDSSFLMYVKEMRGTLFDSKSSVWIHSKVYDNIDEYSTKLCS